MCTSIHQLCVHWFRQNKFQVSANQLTLKGWIRFQSSSVSIVTCGQQGFLWVSVINLISYVRKMEFDKKLKRCRSQFFDFKLFSQTTFICFFTLSWFIDAMFVVLQKTRWQFCLHFSGEPSARQMGRQYWAAYKRNRLNFWKEI